MNDPTPVPEITFTQSTPPVPLKAYHLFRVDDDRTTKAEATAHLAAFRDALAIVEASLSEHELVKEVADMSDAVDDTVVTDARVVSDWFSDGSSVVFAKEYEPTDCVALTGDADSGLSNVKAAIRVLMSCQDLYESEEAGRIPIAKHYLWNSTFRERTRTAWENVLDQWTSALDDGSGFCDEPSSLGDEAFDLEGYRESLR